MRKLLSKLLIFIAVFYFGFSPALTSIAYAQQTAAPETNITDPVPEFGSKEWIDYKLHGKGNELITEGPLDIGYQIGVGIRILMVLGKRDDETARAVREVAKYRGVDAYSIDSKKIKDAVERADKVITNYKSHPYKGRYRDSDANTLIFEGRLSSRVLEEIADVDPDALRGRLIFSILDHDIGIDKHKDWLKDAKDIFGKVDDYLVQQGYPKPETDPSIIVDPKAIHFLDDGRVTFANGRPAKGFYYKLTGDVAIDNCSFGTCIHELSHRAQETKRSSDQIAPFYNTSTRINPLVEGVTELFTRNAFLITGRRKDFDETTKKDSYNKEVNLILNRVIPVLQDKGYSEEQAIALIMYVGRTGDYKKLVDEVGGLDKLKEIINFYYQGKVECFDNCIVPDVLDASLQDANSKLSPSSIGQQITGLFRKTEPENLQPPDPKWIDYVLHGKDNEILHEGGLIYQWRVDNYVKKVLGKEDKDVSRALTTTATYRGLDPLDIEPIQITNAVIRADHVIANLKKDPIIDFENDFDTATLLYEGLLDPGNLQVIAANDPDSLRGRLIFSILDHQVGVDQHKNWIRNARDVFAAVDDYLVQNGYPKPGQNPTQVVDPQSIHFLENKRIRDVAGVSLGGFYSPLTKHIVTNNCSFSTCVHELSHKAQRDNNNPQATVDIRKGEINPVEEGITELFTRQAFIISGRKKDFDQAIKKNSYPKEVEFITQVVMPELNKKGYTKSEVIALIVYAGRTGDYQKVADELGGIEKVNELAKAFYKDQITCNTNCVVDQPTDITDEANNTPDETDTDAKATNTSFLQSVVNNILGFFGQFGNNTSEDSDDCSPTCTVVQSVEPVAETFADKPAFQSLQDGNWQNVGATNPTTNNGGLTADQKKQQFTAENLSSLPDDKYLDLWRQGDPFYMSHVTRQGLRDHVAIQEHMAGVGEYSNDFNQLLEGNQKIVSGLFVGSGGVGLKGFDDPAIEAYLRANYLTEENIRDLYSGEDVFGYKHVAHGGLVGEAFDKFKDQLFWFKEGATIELLPKQQPAHEQKIQAAQDSFSYAVGKSRSLIPRYADYSAVHFATEYVANNTYGAEQGNEVFYVFPADYVFSQYPFSLQGTRKDQVDINDANSRFGYGGWRDLYVWPGQDHGLPINAGFVFLPSDTRVDPQTGSRYASELVLVDGKEVRVPIKSDKDGTYKAPDVTVSAKEYWEKYFDEHPELRPKHIVYYTGDPTSAVKDFLQKNGIVHKDEKTDPLLGFSNNYVEDLRNDPRSNLGYDQIITIGNKIIENDFTKLAEQDSNKSPITVLLNSVGGIFGNENKPNIPSGIPIGVVDPGARNYGEEIGSGSYAIAYKDGDTVTKILDEPVGGMANGQNVLGQEISTTAKANAAGSDLLPQIKEVLTDKDGNLVGYKMEYISGQPLSQYVNNGGRLTTQEAAEIENSLGKLHTVTGVSHGDMHGDNIIVQTNPDGTHTFKFIDYSGHVNKHLLDDSPIDANETPKQKDFHNLATILLGTQFGLDGALGGSQQEKQQFVGEMLAKHFTSDQVQKIIDGLTTPKSIPDNPTDDIADIAAQALPLPIQIVAGVVGDQINNSQKNGVTESTGDPKADEILGGKNAIVWNGYLDEKPRMKDAMGEYLKDIVGSNNSRLGEILGKINLDYETTREFDKITPEDLVKGAIEKADKTVEKLKSVDGDIDKLPIDDPDVNKLVYEGRMTRDDIKYVAQKNPELLHDRALTAHLTHDVAISQNQTVIQDAKDATRAVNDFVRAQGLPIPVQDVDKLYDPDHIHILGERSLRYAYNPNIAPEDQERRVGGFYRTREDQIIVKGPYVSVGPLEHEAGHRQSELEGGPVDQNHDVYFRDMDKSVSHGLWIEGVNDYATRQGLALASKDQALANHIRGESYKDPVAFIEDKVLPELQKQGMTEEQAKGAVLATCATGDFGKLFDNLGGFDKAKDLSSQYTGEIADYYKAQGQPAPEPVQDVLPASNTNADNSTAVSNNGTQTISWSGRFGSLIDSIKSIFGGDNNKNPNDTLDAQRNLDPDKTIRVYRGVTDYDPDEPQVADVIRGGKNPNIKPSDIQDLVSGKITPQDMLRKADNPADWQALIDKLGFVQKEWNTKTIGETLVANFNKEHFGGDASKLFISTTEDPNVAYKFAGQNGKVLVLDIPANKLYDGKIPSYSELDVAGEINDEWITNIVDIDGKSKEEITDIVSNAPKPQSQEKSDEKSEDKPAFSEGTQNIPEATQTNPISGQEPLAFNSGRGGQTPKDKEEEDKRQQETEEAKKKLDEELAKIRDVGSDLQTPEEIKREEEKRQEQVEEAKKIIDELTEKTGKLGSDTQSPLEQEREQREKEKQQGELIKILEELGLTPDEIQNFMDSVNNPQSQEEDDEEQAEAASGAIPDINFASPFAFNEANNYDLQNSYYGNADNSSNGDFGLSSDSPPMPNINFNEVNYAEFAGNIVANNNAEQGEARSDGQGSDVIDTFSDSADALAISIQSFGASVPETNNQTGPTNTYQDPSDIDSQLANLNSGIKNDFADAVQKVDNSQPAGQEETPVVVGPAETETAVQVSLPVPNGPVLVETFMGGSAPTPSFPSFQDLFGVASPFDFSGFGSGQSNGDNSNNDQNNGNAAFTDKSFSPDTSEPGIDPNAASMFGIGDSGDFSLSDKTAGAAEGYYEPQQTGTGETYESVTQDQTGDNSSGRFDSFGYSQEAYDAVQTVVGETYTDSGSNDNGNGGWDSGGFDYGGGGGTYVEFNLHDKNIFASVLNNMKKVGNIFTAYAKDKKEDGAKPAAKIYSGQILNQKKFAIVSTVSEIQTKLSQGKSVSVDDIRQIYKNKLVVKPQGFRNSDEIVVTTGSDGSVKFNVNTGNYIFGTLKIRDKDIYLPTKVSVTGDKQVFAVGITNGSGKVVNTTPQFSNTSPDFAQTEVTVIIFNDKNKNGVKDSNEEIVPLAGATFKLSKAVEDASINLMAGWNLVTLDHLPSAVITARGLLENIAAQGGYATTVSTLDSGIWKSYVIRGDQQYTGENFEIVPGKAYFVRVIKPGSFNYQGKAYIYPEGLNLSQGWNAVGIPYTTMKSVGELSDKINNDSLISEWNSGLWNAYVRKNKETYGDSFKLNSKSGYIIKTDKSANVTIN